MYEPAAKWVDPTSNPKGTVTLLRVVGSCACNAGETKATESAATRTAVRIFKFESVDMVECPA